jgi:hypothetical protein|tara:strand:- start:626 stop:802 length:177 start_codon:yes stop_codon:yes gene_type:complete
MASPQYNKQPKPKESFGQKVKNVSETLGAIKGIYETGKMVYSGIQAAAPYITSGLALL